MSTCLHGQCSPDQCLTDADCQPDQVCACNNGAGPGGVGGHRNSCVPAQCHVDADCGPNGYCSPSLGYCGAPAGYFCHRPGDTCVDGTKDCPCRLSCQYLPTTGAFGCALPPVCAG
ncbi:MAG TPA: hypothetical protein VHA75_11210 [Rugosimonospora sp.]|nr:hypothetical protein [Rugosimonospora sp.]